MTAARRLSICLLFSLAGAAAPSAAITGADDQVLSRFFDSSEPALISYRATRTLEAATRGGSMTARLRALTTLDPVQGFTYTILEESGSRSIIDRVLRKALDTERDVNRRGEGARGALSRENYGFADGGPAEADLRRIALQPLRKDTMLLQGTMTLTPGGDLVRVEGTLVKRPSFWTRRVDVLREYGRRAGVRVPLRMHSTAQVLIVGRSTFDMTYEYESVNDTPVADQETARTADVTGNR